MFNNSTVLVGKIKEFIKINENCQMKIAVSRYYKNENGEYDIDLIPVYATGSISQRIMEYCKYEDVIGVKGRLENINGTLFVIAEKISLLSSKVKDEDK